MFQTPGKGHGLRCLVDLKAGDFIIEYVGEVVSQAQMQKRVEINAQLGQQHYYFMTLQSDQVQSLGPPSYYIFRRFWMPLERAITRGS